MGLRVYLIAPSPNFGGSSLNEDCDIGLTRRYAMMAPAGIATVAALFPDDFEIRLCDEIIEPVDYDDAADVVGLSVNVAQTSRALDIARAFRAAGKTVVLGGPQVSLVPEMFEGEADCLAIGEFETFAPAFIADLIAGRLKPRYRGGKADMAATPQPRWDLYDNARALAGVVQTSRGCPFECSFCDVIQLLGRVQRHKPTGQVIDEIQALYDLGYRQIHLSDDNFTVYRKRAHEVVAAIGAWNAADGREPATFITQMSIDVARDPELVALCGDAGLRYVLIGLETNDPNGLKESKKRQNLKIDLVDQCERIVRAGVSISAGLICGFDSDDLSCFERQLDFAMALPIVNYNISALVAPPATTLYAEMKASGRIVDDDALIDKAGSGSSTTNFEPLHMTRQQLGEGVDWLRRAVLEPDKAIARLERYAAVVGGLPERLAGGGRDRLSPKSAPYLELMAYLARDAGARRVIDCVNDLCHARPDIRSDLMMSLGLYLNKYVRLMMNVPPASRSALPMHAAMPQLVNPP